jgi:hypothetical protein
MAQPFRSLAKRYVDAKLRTKLLRGDLTILSRRPEYIKAFRQQVMKYVRYLGVFSSKPGKTQRRLGAFNVIDVITCRHI